MDKPNINYLLRSLCTVFTFCVLSFTSSAGSSKTLFQTEFNSDGASEVLATVRLSTPDYNWSMGTWTPPLEVRLDGRKISSLIPFRGEEDADYGFILGRPKSGKHKVEIFDPSSKNRNIKTSWVKVDLVTPGDPGYARIKNAPFLYGRPENTNSDAPLLLWVTESDSPLGKELDYTYIWTNEDGGTPTAMLMANYGRTVDIESVYTVRFDKSGAIVSETFQGSGHVIKQFAGKRIDGHPLFRTCTKNNMVCDDGESPYLFTYIPVLFDRNGTRERMLDRNPWINRVAMQELYKEKKLTYVVPDMMPFRVGNTRRYALVDFRVEQMFPGIGLEVALKMKDSGKWRTADFGQKFLRNISEGWTRTGIWMPRGATIDDIAAVRFKAYGPDGGMIKLVAAPRITMLNRDFTVTSRALPFEGKKVLTTRGKPLTVVLPPPLIP